MMNQEDMIGPYGLVTVDGFTSEGLVNTVQHPYTVHVTLEDVRRLRFYTLN